MQARRELEFLEICEGYQVRREDAVSALRQAQESGDAEAIERAQTAVKETGRDIHEFRKWARTMGSPREGVPGRDAVVQMSGPASRAGG